MHVGSISALSNSMLGNSASLCFVSVRTCGAASAATSQSLVDWPTHLLSCIARVLLLQGCASPARSLGCTFLSLQATDQS